jgi:hypothetical protein
MRDYCGEPGEINFDRRLPWMPVRRESTATRAVAASRKLKIDMCAFNGAQTDVVNQGHQAHCLATLLSCRYLAMEAEA